MIEPDCENKLTTICPKNISFSEDSVKIASPPDNNIRAEEADEDSILMGNDATTIKSLEYSQTSINNSSQLMADEKTPKRKSSRLSFSYVGSLFNKLVHKVSSASSESPDLRTKRNLNPDTLELGPLVEQMLSQKVIPSHYVPGVIGLLNQGNTCYMNAVLQCLSNTDQLAAYFLSDHYRACLKLNQSGRSCGRFSNLSSFTHSTTTLNSGSEHVCGQESGKKSLSRSRGLVTEHLACLIRSLWSGRSSNEALSRFKNLVGRMGKQFKGSTQQDAHEFLLWLLDQLHEDLSISADTGKKKSSKAKSCIKGNSSLEDSSTAGYAFPSQPNLPTRSSQSTINELFQAHYRSSLACLKCGHKSHTFDPFLSISLSILSSSSLSLGLKHPIYVVVVYLSATPKQVKIGLQMKHGCTIKDLRETVSNDTNIPKEQLVLADVRLDGHVTTLFDNQPIENFRNLSSIYAIEIPKSNTVENHIVMVTVNKFENGMQYEKFGDPVVLLMHDSSSFFDMQQDLFLEMKQHILVGLNNYFFNKTFLDLRLINFDNRSECHYMSSNAFPLRSSAVNRALARCTSGPRHIMVVAEWYQMRRDNFAPGMNDSCVEHESVNVVRSAQHSSSCSLEDCFHVYTQKEQLGADNAWYCPSCNKKQMETLKTLTLWSLPKILVVHLKRFKHDSSQRSKLDTFVTFPTRDLDLSDHLSKTTSCIPATVAPVGHATPSAFDEKVLPSVKSCADVVDAVDSQDFCNPHKSTDSEKNGETNPISTESALDCPPIVMKSIPNERVSLSAASTNHTAAPRKSSVINPQNETRSKNDLAIDSPSMADLQATRDSCNTSEVSLRDLHLSNSCEGCKSELYDLYAVCNHYGSLHDGHYTAYCRNPLNSSWYLFNDTQVSPIREEEVVTRHAYLLFYKKKSIHASCQPFCASLPKEAVTDKHGTAPRGALDASKDDEPCQQADQSTTSHTGSLKKRPSFFSKIRSSFLKSAAVPSTESQKTDTLSRNTEDEKSIPLEDGSSLINNDQTDSPKKSINLSVGKTPNKDTKQRDKHASGEHGKKRGKGFHNTNHLLDCTKYCILSSSESVICSDVQLSQLHSLQESRV